MTWINLPQWKETNKETYKKGLSSQIRRLEKKMAMSEWELNKLKVLRERLKELEG